VDEGQEVIFEDAPHVELCSWMECSRGHRFLPQLGIATCPGCNAPILARRMVNCPVCNEPTVKVQIRTDHISKGMRIVPMCQGGKSQGEVAAIEMECRHWDVDTR
jgi:hypothetical protein